MLKLGWKNNSLYIENSLYMKIKWKTMLEMLLIPNTNKISHRDIIRYILSWKKKKIKDTSL